VEDGLRERVKFLEEAIEDIRKDASMSEEDRKTISNLFRQLKKIQYTSPTSYYYEAVDQERARLRTHLLSIPEWRTKTSEQVEAQIGRMLLETEWFKKNHITKTRMMEGGEEVIHEPLTFWKYTQPSEYADTHLKQKANEEADRLGEEYKDEQDPELKRKVNRKIQELRNFQTITQDRPARLWYSYRVNPKFKNPNYSNSVRFKVVENSSYYNPNWRTLSLARKEIVNDLTKLYNSLQEGLYQSNQLRTLIPYVRKEGWEHLYDTIFTGRSGYTRNTLNRIKLAFQRQDLEGIDTEEVYGEPEQTDVFGNPLSKAARAIYFRYTKPIDKRFVSFDLFKSMGLFMGEAIKFKALRKHQVEVNSIQKALEGKGETAATKTIASLLNRSFYGEHAKSYKIPALRILQVIVRYLSKAVGGMLMNFGIQSAVKNWVQGHLQTLINAGVYDITLSQYLKGQQKATALVGDFILNPQVGLKPLGLQILDYFGAIQGHDFSRGKNIKSTFFRRYGNLLKSVNRFREGTEFHLQGALAFAILDQFYTSPTSNIKLADAFELQDGKIKIKDGIEIDPEFLKSVRAKIKLYNHHSQGLYDSIYQPEGTKHVWYTAVLFMRKYWQPAMDARYRGYHMDLESGVESIGGYRALTQLAQDIYTSRGQLATAWKGLAPYEKKGFKFVIMDTFVLGALMTLLSAAQGGDGDDDKDYLDYLNWVMRGVEDETEALHPILTPTNFAYGFLDQKTQYSSSDKIVSLVAPAYTKVERIAKDPSLYKAGDYYKYKSNHKVDWNATDPAFAGRAKLAVLFLKLTGMSGLYVTPTEAEYKSRQQNYFNPKIFLDRPTTRYNSEDYDLTKIQKRKEKRKR
jgi:hypothetical protein